MKICFAFALYKGCRKLCGFAFVEVVKKGLWICVCGSLRCPSLVFTIVIVMNRDAYRL